MNRERHVKVRDFGNCTKQAAAFLIACRADAELSLDKDNHLQTVPAADRVGHYLSLL